MTIYSLDVLLSQFGTSPLFHKPQANDVKILKGDFLELHNGTMDWFQIGKGVHQGCILSPCLFNLYVECIMKNAGLDEAQAGSRLLGEISHNLRYADDTTLMAESKEELKSLLMKLKEKTEKTGFKLQHSTN